jgi:hypothetical protein
MMLQRMRDAMPWLFSCHSTLDLKSKIDAVDAKADRIQSQLDRMQEIFDRWTEHHKEAR